MPAEANRPRQPVYRIPLPAIESAAHPQMKGLDTGQKNLGNQRFERMQSRLGVNLCTPLLTTNPKPMRHPKQRRRLRLRLLTTDHLSLTTAVLGGRAFGPPLCGGTPPATPPFACPIVLDNWNRLRQRPVFQPPRHHRTGRPRPVPSAPHPKSSQSPKVSSRGRPCACPHAPHPKSSQSPHAFL